MKIHEYQAKAVLRKHGVNVPEGTVIGKAEEIGPAFDALKAGIVAIKSQIHAGGRGKGTLYDGADPKSAKKVQEGGVKIARNRDEATKYGAAMLGNYLHTIQTGDTGKKVLKVYMEKGTDIKKEFYLSMLLDRGLSRHIVMASTEGGMEIEEVAAKTPEKIIKLPIEAGIGMQPWQARHLLFRLGLPKESLKQGTKFLMSLWKAYEQEDASMLEVNPLVQTASDELIALDCKLTYDDNALYRHPDVAEMRDISEEDPLEVKASEFNLNYIKLDGNVGCMVNGAGLAMATMDIVKLAGAEPANFLDVGGGANVETVSNGFRIILGDPNVKAIFVNIFGGIVQCDRVANGIVEAARLVNISVPLIVRLQGTNAEIARDILAKSGLEITVATTLKDGAEKVGAAIKAL
ncbi:MAG: ADP-forming succinate--CoA ligase subunit beta [Spirochaetales bacterium]|nr:ADP-forming succinate--CoA ligase subunit beta [Leptospiraceae bacterium]MCP5483762.1 ADP-forming succinate--CoA ligase subunit beta [Spirochaetales bacterium]